MRTESEYQNKYERFNQDYQSMLSHWTTTGQRLLWMAYDCGLSIEWADHRLACSDKVSVYKQIINRTRDAEDEFHKGFFTESRRELYYLLMREIQQYCVE